MPARDLGARGSRTDHSKSVSSAAHVLAGVPQWWELRARAAGLSGKWLDVTQVVEAAPPGDALDVAPLLLDVTAETVGQTYVDALSTQDRATHGRHYTSAALAAELWAMTQRALGWKRPQPLTALVRDPACGAGALLLPVIRTHLAATARSEPELAIATLPNVIEGIDNDPSAVWLANVLLAAEVLPLLAVTPRARRRNLPALVRVGDGLAPQESPARVSLMNPPYGRVKLDADERARFADSIYGHANLYGLFMAAGLEGLDDEGVLAALVPTSYLAGRYFEALRDVIVKTAPLREIGFVEDRGTSFTGVLQETCLATFTRKKSRKVAISKVNGVSVPLASVTSPRRTGPWLLPRRADDAPVAAAAIDMPNTLSSVGWKASTGPLVWNRRKANLHAELGSGRAPIIWAADIDGGVVHRDRARDSTRYLALEGTDLDVMVLDHPALLVQRTTAPEQTRRLVVAALTQDALDALGGMVVVENHVNVLRASCEQPKISMATLARVLATTTLDRVMRSLSGSVAVSAYELAAIPLPADDVLAAWETLRDDELDAAVRATYRPTSE